MSGQLSPQIEEDMLQYVYLFYLDFYFLIFRNGKKKMFVVMCSPGSVNMTMLSFV